MTSRPKSAFSRLPQPKAEPDLTSLSGIKQALPVRHLLLLFCVMAAAFFLLAPRLDSLSYGLVDPSFNYAVNNAAASGEAFGSQFISTYGPLGYLVSNYLPQNVHKVMAALALYVLFLGIGVYAFARLYVKDPKARWLAAGGLVYALSMGSSLEPEWGYLSLFLVYCFIYMKLAGRKRLLLLTALSAIGGIFLLTKFTLGFAALPTLIILCLLAADGKLIKRAAWALYAVAVYAVVFLALGHHLGITDFTMYIRTGLIESNNFSGAMSLYSEQTAYGTIFTALALLGILFWPLLHGRRTFLRYLFLSPSLLVIWKYAVVRQDAHLLRLLMVAIPVACLMYVSWASRTRRDRQVLCLIVAFSVLAVWGNNLPFSGGGSSLLAVLGSPVNNIEQNNFVEYFNVTKQDSQWAHYSAAGLGGAALPSSMLQQIGRGGVDVFPWETSIIAANNLKWDNRPSPFSFETYDPYLDNINTKFFESKAAPEYIIWHSTGPGSVGGIDGRHVLWDEPKTFRTVLSRYTLAQSNDSFMLLKKNVAAVPAPSLDQTMSLSAIPATGRWVTLKPYQRSKPLFVQTTIKQSVSDKLTAELIRGKTYFLTLLYANGTVNEYRLIPENTSQGILVNGLPNTWDGLTQFVASRGSTPIDSGQAVVKLKLTDHF